MLGHGTENQKEIGATNGLGLLHSNMTTCFCLKDISEYLLTKRMVWEKQHDLNEI